MPDRAGGRRVLVTVARYAAAGALWLGVSHLIVTPVIVSAYHGRTLPALARLMPGRSSLPVEHYLNIWNSFSGAMLLALVAHLALLLTITRGDGVGPTTAASPPRAALSARARLSLALFAAAFLALTVVGGARHDYLAYLTIWRTVLEQRDPWWLVEGGLLNAYGPLFSTLAPLTLVNGLAPKLLLACAHVWFVIWLTRTFARRGSGDIPRFLIVGAILNPLPWIEVAWFGHFDVLVGIACVAAVHARLRQRDIQSGISLGLGVLLKFLPVVLLPFLVLDRWRLRIRLDLACVITIGLGLSASLQLAGPAALRPVTFAATRGPEQLSIFRYLIGQWSPIGNLLAAADVTALSMGFLLVGCALVFAWCWLHAVPPQTGAVAAVLTTLLLYQVGFVQYQIVPLLLVLYWFATRLDHGAPVHEGRQLLGVIVYFAWLALFDGFYAAIGGFLTPDGGWVWVADVVGLPTFVLGCWALFSILHADAATRALGRLKFRAGC